MITTLMLRISQMAFVSGAVLTGLIVAPAQLNEVRGNAPGNVPQATFFVHRLSADHAEGITTIDMNGDGRSDLVSGAYWYENPGPEGGEWKRHQFRTVDIVGEFVSDCGEWAVD